MVDAYDALGKQEEDYIRVIRDIINQRVMEYAKESNKDKNQTGKCFKFSNQTSFLDDDELNTAEEIIKEVDEIEKDAIAASEKHDLLVSTIKERLEKVGKL